MSLIGIPLHLLSQYRAGVYQQGNAIMKKLEEYIIVSATRLCELLLESSRRDANIAGLYEAQLRSILVDLKVGKKKAPSDILNGYWYYFSPEGPWGIWERFPLLVQAMSELLNLLGLQSDEEFEAYTTRHAVDNRV
jgi:hypothetical protein